MRWKCLSLLKQRSMRLRAVEVANLREHIREGTFDTVLDEIGFDAKGDVTAPGYVFYEWKDGS